MIRYRKKKSDKPAAVTIIILVFLIIFSKRNPETSALPSNLLNTIISPINSFFYDISASVQELYDSAFGSKATQEKVEQLTAENKRLQEEVEKMDSVIRDREFLENEYLSRQQLGNDAIEARITARDPSPIFVRFTMNKGSRDGIKKGDIVVEGVKDSGETAVTGLVGRVTEVGLNYAKVSTLMDQANNVSVLFQRNGDYGVVNYRDQEAFFGYSLDASSDLKEGDKVFSSGIGGLYPRGIYIGEIKSTSLSEDELSRNFTMTAAVDFSRLYRVLVIPCDHEIPIEAGEEAESSSSASTGESSVSAEKPSEDESSGAQEESSQLKEGSSHE